jgi:hypothetical protein
MASEATQFQRRLAFVVSGGTLVTLGVRNRLTPVGGLIQAAMGGLLLRAGVGWLKSRLDSGSARTPILCTSPRMSLFPPAILLPGCTENGSISISANNESS